MRTKMLRPFGFYFTTAAIALAASCDPHLTWGQRLALVSAAWWIPAIHELGHATLALALRMPVLASWAVPGMGRTRVATRGRQLEFGLVALAGPLAGVGAAILVHAFARAASAGDGVSPVCARWLDCIALAGGLESVANLLPVSPLLDGTKALKALRAARLAHRSERRLATELVPQPVALTIPARARRPWVRIQLSGRAAWCARARRGHAGQSLQVHALHHSAT